MSSSRKIGELDALAPSWIRKLVALECTQCHVTCLFERFDVKSQIEFYQKHLHAAEGETTYLDVFDDEW